MTEWLARSQLELFITVFEVDINHLAWLITSVLEHSSSKLFRRTRLANDGYIWLTLGVTFALMIPSGLFALSALTSGPMFPGILSLVLFALSLFVFVFSVRGILYPYEWELVVDGECIRWGRTDRPDAQQRLCVTKITRLIYDKSDNKVLADVGSWRLIAIADYIVLRVEDHAALVEHLRENFAHLKIETR